MIEYHTQLVANHVQWKLAIKPNIKSEREKQSQGYETKTQNNAYLTGHFLNETNRQYAMLVTTLKHGADPPAPTR
jgi:hypothetical protein